MREIKEMKGIKGIKTMKMLLQASIFFSWMLFYQSLVLAATVITPSDLTQGTDFATEDVVLTETIKQKIAADNRITSPKTEINTNKGIVSLIGSFNTAEEIGYLVETISSTPGVQDIDISRVVLSTPSDVSLEDLVITSRIRGLIIRDNIYQDNTVSNMGIQTKEGVVFLNGTVSNTAQQAKIMELVRSVPNVKKIVAEIMLKP